jgi:hypothetical protein
MELISRPVFQGAILAVAIGILCSGHAFALDNPTASASAAASGPAVNAQAAQTKAPADAKPPPSGNATRDASAVAPATASSSPPAQSINPQPQSGSSAAQSAAPLINPASAATSSANPTVQKAADAIASRPGSNSTSVPTATSAVASSGVPGAQPSPASPPATGAQQLPSSPPKLAAVSPPDGASLRVPQGATNSTSSAPGIASVTPPSSPVAGSPGTDNTSEHSRSATPGETALRNASDASLHDPYNWSVMVFKSRHQLVVYFAGHLYKTYEAVFGRNLDFGTKVWAGDRRTPEGVYRIISKWPNRRWRYFLKLNYPNDYDRAHYAEVVSAGGVPRWRGRSLPEGDGIGIHGTDEPVLNAGKVNWTTGCISVDNGAIDELDALLPVGALVIINP